MISMKIKIENCSPILYNINFDIGSYSVFSWLENCISHTNALKMITYDV